MTSLERRILYRLRAYGPMDVFQIHKAIRANLHAVRVAARELNERELVHVSGWHKPSGVKRIPVYTAGAGVNITKDQIEREDNAYATQIETRKTIESLRTSATGQFDPFRVLRAQLAVN